MKKIIIILVLLLFTFIILAPPLLHGYVYPNNGDDTAMHLNIIKHGNLSQQLYAGYIIFYPLQWLSKVMDINNLFMWINYIVLVLVGFAWCFVLTKLVNYKVGLLSLLIPFTMSLGFISQFDFGQIFNIINMGIILPFLVYFAVKWYQTRNRLDYCNVLALTALFSLFHTSGLYALPVIGLLWAWVFWNRRSDKHLIGSLYIVLIVCALCASITVLKTIIGMPAAPSHVFAGRFIPISLYLQVVSPLLLALWVAFFVMGYKIVSRPLLVILSLMALVVFTLTLGISVMPDRQLYDFATLLGLITTVVVGTKLGKNTFTYFACVLMALAFFGFIGAWFHYNSAIKQPDLEAIGYIGAESYATNQNVTVGIYKQYAEGQYLPQGADLYIQRSKPMTYASDSTSEAYLYAEHGIDSLDNYPVKLATFTDKDLTITIYGKESK